jgi:hypothetical protein
MVFSPNGAARETLLKSILSTVRNLQFSFCDLDEDSTPITKLNTANATGTAAPTK